MTMLAQALLRSERFSLCLRGTDGGRLIFGGVNRNLFHGELLYYDLISNVYNWKIHMHYVAVSGHETQYCSKAVIDCGAQFIYGPPLIIREINRHLLNRDVPLYETTFLNEDEVPELVHWPVVDFAFAYGPAHSIPLGPMNCVISDVPGQISTVFRPLVIPPGMDPYFVPGLPWLRQYHTVFDFGRRRIGFALSTD